MTHVRPWLIISLVALLYALGHFNWYAPTPLGQVPVLDEQENLTLARQIATGTLPPEPFYRAMGYPLLLATLLGLGVPTAQLPVAALLLGVGLHALAAVLVGALARRWFDDARAGLIAGLLAALNPVFVHYATQRLDATLGTVLFLAGLHALRLGSTPPSTRAPLDVTVLWTLAALVRPQFLTVLLVLPVLWYWQKRSSPRPRIAAAALAMCTALLAAQGLWQQHVGGEFRVLPWQGAYNLWASNQPGSHGRYYAQSLALPPGAAPDNPAKLESLALYAREHGAPGSIDAMNAHWRARFLAHVSGEPLAWLELLARKTYAFLNDWEQYNNKTYAFHSARSPWLAWNPIGWGVLLVLGVAGAWRLARTAPEIARAAGLIALAAAAGVILFFVSARFRLPVAVLLCVPAGAALARPAWFVQLLPSAQRTLLGVALAGVAALTFFQFDGVRDRRPFIQDHLLIARAAQTVGDDAEIWTHAEAAIALDPSRLDAAEYLVTAGFNRQLTAPLPETDRDLWRTAAAALLAAAPTATTPYARLISAVAVRDVPALRALAANRGPAAPDAAGALVVFDAAQPGELALVQSAALDAGSTFFLMARQALAPADFAAWADSRQPPGWSKALATARTRLFDQGPARP